MWMELLIKRGNEHPWYLLVNLDQATDLAIDDEGLTIYTGGSSSWFFNHEHILDVRFVVGIADRIAVRLEQARKARAVALEYARENEVEVADG